MNDSTTSAFLWICEIPNNITFTEHLQETSSSSRFSGLLKKWYFVVFLLHLHKTFLTFSNISWRKNIWHHLWRRKSAQTYMLDDVCQWSLKIHTSCKFDWYPYKWMAITNDSSKHFNVVSTFFLGWYDVATLDNVKLRLKQRCICQSWNLQHWPTFNQRFLKQHDMNNVRQRRNKVVILKNKFYNVDQRQNFDQRRNNFVKMTIRKKLKSKLRVKSKMIEC